MKKIKQVIIVTKLHPNDLRPRSRHLHHQTLREVCHFLADHAVRYRIIDRKNLAKTVRSDLIITVGGDGTVLAASHYTLESPIFPINSAPTTSTGFFCRTNEKTFRPVLKRVLDGKIKPKPIPRLVTFVNGKKMRPYGLNEVLFASQLQGETSRYQIRVGSHEEEQKSSGIWVATGAGSTGAIYSAGSKKDSVNSERLQYWIREPFRYQKNQYKLRKGFLKTGETVSITSHMNQGMIFIDGARWHYKVKKNDRITVRGGQAPLKIFL
ncbi:MAG: NAD(+)/NADH kinase [Deltaproteobacteria bacterium]|nr:NAD(+)/NADH kinase [Deltaproteobacteria bacterium]